MTTVAPAAATATTTSGARPSMVSGHIYSRLGITLHPPFQSQAVALHFVASLSPRRDKNDSEHTLCPMLHLAFFHATPPINAGPLTTLPWPHRTRHGARPKTGRSNELLEPAPSRVWDGKGSFGPLTCDTLMQHGPAPASSMQCPSAASLRGYGWWREPPVRRLEPIGGKPG